MTKEYYVEGTINLNIKFKDTFSDNWDDNDIVDYIKKNIDLYLENEIEVNDVEIDSMELISYEDATCDELYDEMRLEQLERGEE